MLNFATQTFKYLSVGHDGEPVGKYFIPADTSSVYQEIDWYL